MTSAVQEVHSLCPHILARQCIELCSACPVWEVQHSQLNVSFKNEGVCMTLLFGDRSQSYGSCNVCGAVLISRPSGLNGTSVSCVAS